MAVTVYKGLAAQRVSWWAQAFIKFVFKPEPPYGTALSWGPPSSNSLIIFIMYGTSSIKTARFNIVAILMIYARR